MGYAALLVGLLVVLRSSGALARRSWWGHGSDLTFLLAIFWLPSVGILLSLLVGSQDARRRLDVQFLGYRLPVDALMDCARPTPRAMRPPVGFWIGGGGSRDDPSPDALVAPGYRRQMIELCRDGAASHIELIARVVDPGLDVGAGASAGAAQRVPALSTLSRPHTQRVVLEPLEPARLRAERWPVQGPIPNSIHSTRATDVEQWARTAWQNDRARALEHLSWWRQARGLFHSGPVGDSVLCFDPAQADGRCRANLAGSPDSVFLWRRGLKRSGALDGLASRPDPGAIEVAFAPPVVAPGTALGPSFIETLPGFSARMIIGRIRGRGADRYLVPANSAFPEPFALGQELRVRVANSREGLLLLAEEPSVQLRADDLFGGGSGLPEGQFNLCFGTVEGEALLAIDLASRADHHREKPPFAGPCWTIEVSTAGDRVTVRSAQAAVTTWRTGEVVGLKAPGGSFLGFEALVTVRQVEAPAGLLAVPFAAAVLLSLGLVRAARQGALGYEWDLAGVVACLLIFRLAITARYLADEASSWSHMQAWLGAGAHVLLVPALVASLAAPTPPVAGRRRVWTWITAMRPQLVAGAIAASFTWLIVGIVVTPQELPKHIAALLVERNDLVAPFVAILSALLPVLVFAGLRRIMRGRQAGQASGFPPPLRPLGGSSFSGGRHRGAPSTRRGRLRNLLCTLGSRLRGPGGVHVAISAFVGALFLALRVLLSLFGYGESFGDIKIDVFHLPIAAACFAALGAYAPGFWSGLWGFAMFLGLAFVLPGLFLSDAGLAWVGLMGFVLAFPFCEATRKHPWRAMAWCFLVGTIAFFLPQWRPVLKLVEALSETRLEESAPPVVVPDPLLVNLSRDKYRLIDSLAPEFLDEIPSELAREVIEERQKVRYLALNGAWREGLRRNAAFDSVLHGAGMLQASPVVGDRIFRTAARWDYVFPVYVRSEFGTIGILGVLAAYTALLVWGTVAAGRRDDSGIALFSLALLAGCGLFMIGGTHRIFPFSGKWTPFMAIGSPSELALSLSCILLAIWSRKVAR